MPTPPIDYSILKKKSKYFQLIELFIEMDLLGHYDENKFSICLYGVSNDGLTHHYIKGRIDKITKKYRYIFDDLNAEIVNVNILDIVH